MLKDEGAEGTELDTDNTAPFPSDETIDYPITLYAVTLAVTLAESTRLKGEDRRVATGIEQLLEDKIIGLVSASQFVKSFSKVAVDVLISNL
jgi:hypothetical protein